MDTTENVDKAVSWIKDADGLLITAGAGMGVDSGLPDFRGQEGFWRAYPALRHEGFSFEQMATAERFEKDPALAWGFYGHRLRLYRETEPHEGFSILRRWAAHMPRGAFVSRATWTVNFRKRASRRVASMSATAPSTNCSAWRPAGRGLGRRMGSNRSSILIPRASSAGCHIVRIAADLRARTS